MVGSLSHGFSSHGRGLKGCDITVSCRIIIIGERVYNKDLFKALWIMKDMLLIDHYSSKDKTMTIGNMYAIVENDNYIPKKEDRTNLPKTFMK
ncbi:hypothetical protein CR513_39438, partial [Mucuna pruriens]